MAHGVGVQPRHRSVQIVERQLVHGLPQLGAHAAHGPTFVGHQQTAGFPDAGGHRVHVQRLDGAQVDHFARDTLGLQCLRRLHCQMHDLSGRRNRQIGARTRNTRDTERHQMVARRHLPPGCEQCLALQHQHRVSGTQSGFHETLGVGGS